MEIAAWADRFFPRIAPFPGVDDVCWVAWLKTRTAEHYPPFYWLGRALDAVADGGDGEALAARLVQVHGHDACAGQSESDERVQDVLSEACAFAWAAAHLGPPRLVLQGESPDGPLLVHVPAHDAYLAPRRLRPVQSIDELIEHTGREAAAAATLLPPAAGRILYLDVYLHPFRYAQNVGYRTELTEPLRAAAKHFAAEHGLGYVLTRPFQWGNAIEAVY